MTAHSNRAAYLPARCRHLLVPFRAVPEQLPWGPNNFASGRSSSKERSFQIREHHQARVCKVTLLFEKKFLRDVANSPEAAFNDTMI